MFATIKSFIPEPRHTDQPGGYVGRHRVPDTDTRAADTSPDETGTETDTPADAPDLRVA